MPKDIRLNVDFFSHPKTRKLKRLLSDNAVLALIRLWTFAARHRTRGILYDMDDDDIAVACGYEGDIKRFKKVLLDLRFLTQNGSDILEINDWEEHQGYVYHSMDRRTLGKELAAKRWNKRKEVCVTHSVTQCLDDAGRNAPIPIPIPIPIPDPIPNTYLPDKQSVLHVSSSKKRKTKTEERSESFERFWSFYPKKVGKGAALKAWLKLKPSEVLVDAILTALEWQKESQDWTKDGGKYIPHPQRYLNEQRWLDEKKKEWYDDD